MQHDVTQARLNLGKYRIITDEFVKKLHKDYPNLTKYSKKEIRNIIINFNRYGFGGAITSTREGVVLPVGLGNIFLGAYKPRSEKYKPYDYGRSAKYDKPMRHVNFHTDGYACAIYHTKNKYGRQFDDLGYWKFEPERELKKMSSRAFSENFRKFIVVRKQNYTNELLSQRLSYRRNKNKPDSNE